MAVWGRSTWIMWLAFKATYGILTIKKQIFILPCQVRACCWDLGCVCMDTQRGVKERCTRIVCAPHRGIDYYSSFIIRTRFHLDSLKQTLLDSCSINLSLCQHRLEKGWLSGCKQHRRVNSGSVVSGAWWWPGGFPGGGWTFSAGVLRCGGSRCPCVLLEPVPHCPFLPLCRWEHGKQSGSPKAAVAHQLREGSWVPVKGSHPLARDVGVLNCQN